MKYEVSFLHTYRTKPSKHYPKGHKKTVHRYREVEANNPAAAMAKARRGIGPGHFHDFEIKAVSTRTSLVDSLVAPFRSRPVFSFLQRNPENHPIPHSK